MTKGSVYQNVKGFLWEILLAVAEFIASMMQAGVSERTPVATLISYPAREGVPINMSHVLIIDHRDDDAFKALVAAGATTISVIGDVKVPDDLEGVHVIKYKLPLSQLVLDPSSLPTLVILGSSSALGAHCSQVWVTDLPSGAVIICQDLYPLLMDEEESLVYMHGYGSTHASFQLQHSVYSLHKLVLVTAETTRTGILRKV